MLSLAGIRPAHPAAWYVVVGDRVSGPYPKHVLHRMQVEHLIRANDMLWCPTTQDWRLAQDCRELWSRIAVRRAEMEQPAPGQQEKPPREAALPPTGGAMPLRPAAQPLHQVERPIAANAGFLLRHWRGALPLGTAYWGCGALVGLIMFGLLRAETRLDLILSAQQSLAKFAAIWLLLLAVTVWQQVGIWRAAKLHCRLGRRRRWGWAAQVMVILSLMQTGWLLVRVAAPEIVGQVRLLTGDPALAPTVLRVLSGGRELEFSGEIRPGAAAMLRATLRSLPDLQVVHLNSPGGRVDEGRHMRDLIRARGVDTYVSNTCSSACTIAFLGGIHRIINPAGRLGFHAARVDGLSGYAMIAENNFLRRETIRFGVSAAFADRIYATSSSSIWLPAIEELRDAGYITGVSHGEFAVSGLGPSLELPAVVLQLRQVPLFAALERADREQFMLLARLFADAARRGAREGDLLALEHSILRQAVRRQAARASDEALLGLARQMAAEISLLNRRAPQLCGQLMFPGDGAPIPLERALDTAMLARDRRAMEDILQSAAGAPARHAGGDSDALETAVLDRAETDFAPDMRGRIAQLAAHRLAGSQSCAVGAAYLAEILSLPPAEAARLLRHLAESNRLL